MIRYALACDQAHTFESWFPSSEAYDAQTARGFVACPVCDSIKIEKRIMAPAVARTDKPAPVRPATAAVAPAASPQPDAPQPMALLSDQERHVRAMLKAVREHVVKTADNVGDRFADEARKMHYGEIDHRPIYGQAAPPDAKALIEEGIAVHPLPIVPDDRN